MVSKIIGNYFSKETELFIEVTEENIIDLRQKVMNTKTDAEIIYEANIGMGASIVVNR